MYYMYILKSSKDKRLYIGSTVDLKKRIKEHQSGKVFAQNIVYQLFLCITKRT